MRQVAVRIRVLATIAIIGFASIPLAGQGPAPAAKAPGQTPAAKAWKAPRTADGQPDLQGVWNFSTITPLERPADLAGREFLTDAEIADRQKRAQIAATDEARAEDRNRDVSAAYNDFWWDRGTKVVATKRTSLVIDPPDGRIPALTPEAQAREAERAEHVRRQWGPEDFDLNDRCLVGFNAGPPIIPDAYNNNFQIFQSRDHVVILNEMVHSARIVPLDGRPHVGQAIKQWTGDSRGRWEGDTLVVDTTNFNSQGRGLMGGFRGSGDENMHLVERFTRINPGVLLYEFTIDDPTTYTKPWKVQLPTVKIKDRIYEYACHEGNYALGNMLSAARAQEKAQQTETQGAPK